MVMVAAMALALAGAAWAPAAAGQVQPPQPPVLPQAPGALQLQFDQAKALFDAFEYEKAIAAFDEMLAAMVGAPEPQNDELLAQLLELRGRAKFALGDEAGAEQDFAALLSVRPEYRLAADISPRVVALYETVMATTVGQVTITMTPPGDLDVDRRTYTIPTEGATLSLTAGDHQLSVTRQGFAPVSQLLVVAAGESRELSLTLERISASLEVQTAEAGVDVLLDGTPRGTTAPAGTGPATLLLSDLPLGTHQLVLRRECFLDAERTISLVADDLRTDPIRLEPATAPVTVRTGATGAQMFLDGEPRGPAPGEISVCQGEHVLEVRGPTGRFVERREWRAGQPVTLDATLRSAFPIVSVTGATADAVRDQVAADVARVLAPAEHVLVYAPDQAQVDAAMQAENIPSGWLADAVTGADTALPRDVIRDMGRRLAARLGVQGFVAVVAGAARFQATVGFLAAGSGEPEAVTVTTADQASPRAALDRLSAPLPPVLRPSVGLSAIDVIGVTGAVVVRSGGAAAEAGIGAGEIVTSAGGTPLASVADLRGALAASGETSVTLDVAGVDGTVRQVAVRPRQVADLLPLGDASLLYNRALLELQELTQTAQGADERAAAHLNYAIVLIRLGSFDEALQALGQARLEAGPGVSAGTVAYLRGLALEGVGKSAEARAAFGEAAAATGARLGYDGPLVSPLARQKLGGGGA